MRVLGIIAFLLVLIVPMPLFAQQTGGSTSDSGSTAASQTISTEFGDAYGGVQNAAAQAQGTFVGAGRPDAFVGMADIYSIYGNTTNRSASSSAARRTTAARTTVRPTTTTARRATTTAARTSQTGASNSQTIRSVTSMDFDAAMPAQRIQPATAETLLNRVHGIQDSHVSFRSSPMGTTAVLTGTVASGRERRVAQQLLLFEPGINRVENRLEIR